MDVRAACKRVCKRVCEVCVVWCGVVWCGVVWCGVVWCGVVWCGMWCGMWCACCVRCSFMLGVVCLRGWRLGVGGELAHTSPVHSGKWVLLRRRARAGSHAPSSGTLPTTNTVCWGSTRGANTWKRRRVHPPPARGHSGHTREQGQRAGVKHPVPLRRVGALPQNTARGGECSSERPCTRCGATWVTTALGRTRGQTRPRTSAGHRGGVHHVSAEHHVLERRQVEQRVRAAHLGSRGKPAAVKRCW
jgi:hypothetical protein